jgi:hypothetical protein
MSVIHGGWHKIHCLCDLSLACKTGKECGRKPGKIIVKTPIEQMMRLPVEFSDSIATC